MGADASFQDNGDSCPKVCGLMSPAARSLGADPIDSGAHLLGCSVRSTQNPSDGKVWWGGGIGSQWGRAVGREGGRKDAS